MRCVSSFPVVAFVLFSICGVPAAEVEAPFGLAARVPWTTSRVFGTPEPPPPYTVARAFPKLTFKNPLYIAQEPGSGRFLVGELSGKIWAFTRETPDNGARELFLDIGRELYAFSFHPDYASNGYVFTFSPKSLENDVPVASQLSRVSRYQATQESPRRCDPESERVIIEWPAGGHNGGEALIGPDGCLYISTGDGTSGSDPDNTGQGVNDLLSVILRVDIDNLDEKTPYTIPPDNPFITYPEARPEIWAFGFRNPWRMSFDAKTGRLWVGDVGQDLWEMIWIVERGGNYGWSVREGTHPFHPDKQSGPGPILPPVVEHHHTECRSITGGYVYYGDKHPELNGVYFYGDYEYGMIWGVRHDGQKVTWQSVLADTPLRIPSFGVSRDGEILLMDHVSGELYELVRQPVADTSARFPRKLSETGIFESVADHRVAQGVIPYSVNTAQWLDNASKQRFMALPGQSTIRFVERSDNARTWDFEDGTVHLETISLEMEAGQPRSRRRIETRLLVKQQNHWLGYSYLWNDEQTDAELVGAPGRDLLLSIRDGAVSGGQRQQTWHIPSRNECMACHSRAAGFVLGIGTAQMNRDHLYGDVADNQLRAFNHVNLFSKPLDKRPGQYDALANAYDASADLNDRARAYLHVNCSVCHVADGGGNSKIQLKYYQKFEDTQLVTAPLHGTFGLDKAQIVQPGDPFASVLFYRLAKWGRGRMPHIGSNLHDPAGLDLIEAWIASLPHDAPAANESVDRLSDDAPIDSTRSAMILARMLDKQGPGHAARPRIVARAMAHPDPNVRDLFERFLPEQQRTRRLGDYILPEEILPLAGSADRGRQIFLSGVSQCRNCHRAGNHGGSTFGPDLVDVARKYPRQEILESLLDPSKKIDPKYATHLLATTKGQLYSGIVVEKSDLHVLLHTLESGQPRELRVPAHEVDELQPQPKSLMPDRLLRDFTAQQAADLLEFVMSLK